MRTNPLLPLMYEMAVFVQVVEAGSFSEAARQLGTAPSAVSRAISRLEAALHTPLLQRTTRKLRLSEAGVEAYRHCQDMLRAIEAVADVAGEKQIEPSGKLRISAPRALGRHLIHPHIAEFLAKYPQVDVVFSMEDRPVDLIEDHVDLAFCITDDPPPGLKGRKLFRIEQIVCATPEYLQRAGTPHNPKQLTEHSCITLSENPIDSRWKFSKDSRTLHVDIKGRYTVNHAAARLDAIKQHVGIGCVPKFMAEEALASGELLPVLQDWQFTTNYQGDVWMLYPPTRYVPLKVKSFVDFICEKLI